MQMIFTRRFCSAHRLTSDKSLKCQVPHGHNWEVKVTIISTEDKRLDYDVNMVEEFGAAKKRWHTWIDDYVDHSFMLNANDQEFIEATQNIGEHARIMTTPGDPTTEMCCALFMSKLNVFLQEEHGGSLICSKIELVETPTNTVAFDGNCYAHLPVCRMGDTWWTRADTSTNDL